MDSPPQFDFDFSFLDLEELRNQCIVPDEVIDVFYKVSTFYDSWLRTDGFAYMLGYSFKNKFISFTFELTQDEEIVRVIDLYLSDELEIKNRYYGKR